MKSQNFEDIESRKLDHIRLCLDPKSQAYESVFRSYSLPYTALPEISMTDVDTSTKLYGKTLQMPIVIASMTGGSEHGRLINTNLAIAAETCGVALSLGSQRIGLEKPEAKETFELVRKYAPNTFIIANMGAVQLNYGHNSESYQQVVDMVDADALYLHINPLQEALQPGGDTNFEGLLAKIELLVKQVGVPVFVKEVGHGISQEVAKMLFDVGVSAVDVAGVGGTSYAWVEAERAKNENFAHWFKDYGIPTDRAIEYARLSKTKEDQLIIASGGIRSPLDGLISRALGADLFSAAVPFLSHAIEKTPDSLVKTIEDWKKGLEIAMFASGVLNWNEAKGLKLTRK